MRRLLTPFGVLLAVALVALALAGMFIVPPGAQLPVHWNAAGVPDQFASRETALLWPVGVAAIAWAAMGLTVRIAPPAMVEGGIDMAGVVLAGLTAVFLVIEGATILMGLGVSVNMLQTLSFAIAGLLVILGAALPRSRPNGIAGIRIPTTLADPNNWRATHRFTGWLCVGAGVVLAFAASVAPTTALIGSLVASIALPMLASTLYSHAYARRKSGI